MYSAVGDAHGVHKSSVCRAVASVKDYLHSISGTYVHFPQPHEYLLYLQDFAQMHGFPCVLGCIDGTHIGIQAPANDEKYFVNPKGFHSLNVMVNVMVPSLIL